MPVILPSSFELGICSTAFAHISGTRCTLLPRACLVYANATQTDRRTVKGGCSPDFTLLLINQLP
jgi:hypothetical protein